MTDREPVRLPRGRPTDKWSARQLLELLRRREAETPDEESERLRARVEELSIELRAAREANVQGVAGDRVAGKKSVADLRTGTWRRFSNAVERLPIVRRSEGMREVRMRIASDLIPDLYLLGLEPPKGTVEARERDRLRRCLDHPAWQALLSRPDASADRLRILFLSQVARAYLRPSIYAVYENGSEDAKVDRWGEVIK